MTEAQRYELRRIEQRHGPTVVTPEAGDATLQVGLQRLDPHNRLYVYRVLRIDQRGTVLASAELNAPDLRSDNHGLLRVA